MPNIEKLSYQSDKSSQRRCSIEKAARKNFAIFTGSPVFKSILGRGWNKVAGRPAILLKRDSNIDVFLWILQNLKNTCFEEHLRTAASENNSKKRFLGKATGHNDHYMINMGGQRPKIGGNWPMTGPYLQHCKRYEI